MEVVFPPTVIVRTPREFYRKYAQWVAIYFAGFFLVHITWRWRRFRGDPAILPALQLLTGIGLTLAVSLKDPLRDTLEFANAMAALNCTRLGARGGIGTVSEARALMERVERRSHRDFASVAQRA